MNIVRIVIPIITVILSLMLIITKSPVITYLLLINAIFYILDALYVYSKNEK